jgi:hypothetical protein
MINEDYSFPEKHGQVSILIGSWLQYACPDICLIQSREILYKIRQPETLSKEH